MVDTVVIEIDKDDFTINDDSLFTTETKGLLETPYIKVNKYMEIINKPPMKLKREYGYLPRVKLYRAIRTGGFITKLRIEFSAPKLIYNNNFDEVENKDLDIVCKTLSNKLEILGISVTTSILANAEVMAIHYSKNIVLTDYSNPKYFIDLISKADLGKMRDHRQDKYANDGMSFIIHTNTYQLSIYDKLKELKQAKISELRSIETDNYPQLHLFETNKIKQPFEVLRIELRVTNRAKIKKFLESINLKSDLNFKSLFRKQIARDLLTIELDKLIQKIPKYVLANQNDIRSKLVSLLLNNPEITHSSFIKAAFAEIIIEHIGVSQFREIASGFGNSAWYRFKNSIADINYSTDLNHTEKLDFIRKEVKHFQQVKMQNFFME